MAPRSSELSQDWQVKCPIIKMRSKYLLQSSEWADCTFQFQRCGAVAGAGDSKDTLDAHKLILAMASPVFAAMFYGKVSDKEGPVLISDIEMPVFSAMLDYIYTDEVKISNTEMAVNLYYAANKYILVRFKKRCLTYLFDNLTPDNVCHIYEFACFYGASKLEKCCLEHGRARKYTFQHDHHISNNKLFSTRTQEVLKSLSFKKAQINTLHKIFSLDSLYIKSEMDLYNAVSDYIRNNTNSDDHQNAAIHSEAAVMKYDDDNEIKDKDNICEKCCAAIVLKPNSNKSENARKNLRGVIEQIRFLTLSAADLAKISEDPDLLNEREKLALFINLSSSVTNVPMPDRFSISRESRINEDVGTLRYTKHNVKNMVLNKGVYNSKEHCYVRNLRWRISVRQSSDKKGRKTLGVHACCDVENKVKSWSCYAKVVLKLVAGEENSKAFIRKVEKRIDSSGFSLGYNEFIDWEELLDPSKNYINDDGSITLEAHITVKSVKIIDLQSRYYSDYDD